MAERYAPSDRHYLQYPGDLRAFERTVKRRVRRIVRHRPREHFRGEWVLLPQQGFIVEAVKFILPVRLPAQSARAWGDIDVRNGSEHSREI